MHRNLEGGGTAEGERTPALNLAVVGGGKACRSLIELLAKEPFPWLNIRIVGVSDINPRAEGLLLAKRKGIYTTSDFQDFFQFEALDGLIELTDDREVLMEIIRRRPKGLGVLDHNLARLFWELFLMYQRLKTTEQKFLAEQMLSEFLIHQIDERVVILKPNFTIVDANDAYLKAVRKTKDEVIGAHCYEVTHGRESPCAEWLSEKDCPMIETMRTGRSAQVIHEHTTEEGYTFFCDLVTYPVKNSKGEIVRVIELWRDITREISARLEKRERDLMNNMKALIQEDRMISLGKLVASCVHEINNPIQGLLTFCGLMQEILKEGEPTPKELDRFRGYLSLMFNELERCGKIISGLLSFSRECTMEMKCVDINDVLESVITLTRHKMELQNVQLVTKLSGSHLEVVGDKNALQQCFLNLIFNAVEAMPGGGTLTVVSEREEAKKRIRVSILDTGCGIPEEELDHIMEPFFTTKKEGEGTGLGLSIVYGVVKSHGGHVEVESRQGAGSQFTLYFPVG